MSGKENLDLNLTTIKVITDQWMALTEKADQITSDHRKTLNQISGSLHAILLDLATSSVVEQERIEYAVDTGTLRVKLGREPIEYDVSVCKKIGYPEFQAGEPVWAYKNGDKFRATVIEVKAFNDHNGPHWKFRVTQFDRMFAAGDLLQFSK